jgi:hypothetical protein
MTYTSELEDSFANVTKFNSIGIQELKIEIFTSFINIRYKLRYNESGEPKC